MNTCPGCGRCNVCGRRSPVTPSPLPPQPWVYPNVPVQPQPWYQPIWISTPTFIHAIS